jgi:V8-like Glu-specific endopeptidase
MNAVSRVAWISFLVVATVQVTGTADVNAQSVVSHSPSERGSASGPTGQGLSRLPLISPSAFPVGGRQPQTAAPRAVPGSAPGSHQPENGNRTSEAYGTFSWPFTTARVANTTTGKGAASVIENHPVTGFPYRAAGKLWMRFGTSWFVCTASLIKKGLLVTAAHCVHNYGQGSGGFADEVLFYPANVSDSTATTQPYSVYRARRIYIPGVYRNGTDTCEAGAVGIVCNNDVAVVVLRERRGLHAGETLGTFGYGWDGYSFVTSAEFGDQFVAAVTQLGYPVAWDGGFQMQRGSSFGKRVLSTGTNGKQLINTQLGSAMTGGSSGGPWIVNFGTNPTVTGTATPGTAANRLVVVGTTSWGYDSTGPKVQGASWFGRNSEFPLDNYGSHGAGNIGALVNTACSAFPTAC